MVTPYAVHPPALDEDDDIITTLSSLTASQPSQASHSHPPPFPLSQARGHTSNSDNSMMSLHSNLIVKTEDLTPISLGGGILYSPQVPSSTPSHPHMSQVAMEIGSGRDQGGGGEEGRVVVSFVTKIEIASEGEAMCENIVQSHERTYMYIVCLFFLCSMHFYPCIYYSASGAFVNHMHCGLTLHIEYVLLACSNCHPILDCCSHSFCSLLLSIHPFIIVSHCTRN